MNDSKDAIATVYEATKRSTIHWAHTGPGEFTTKLFALDLKLVDMGAYCALHLFDEKSRSGKTILAPEAELSELIAIVRGSTNTGEEVFDAAISSLKRLSHLSEQQILSFQENTLIDHLVGHGVQPVDLIVAFLNSESISSLQESIDSIDFDGYRCSRFNVASRISMVNDARSALGLTSFS